MTINTYIQEAIQKIENDKQRAVQAAKEKVQLEKIKNHNNEVDQYKTKALAELRTKYDADCAEIIKKSDANKLAYAKQEIEAATAVVVAVYNEKISQLTALLEKE